MKFSKHFLAIAAFIDVCCMGLILRCSWRRQVGHGRSRGCGVYDHELRVRSFRDRVACR